jgi:hypothetical protein
VGIAADNAIRRVKGGLGANKDFEIGNTND